MFQYAAFLPVFRSHGADTPRGIWNFGKPVEPFSDSLLKIIHLLDIKDQFMFGPAFLVCPVTTTMYYEKESVVLHGVEKKKTVYLPKGTNWIDFWINEFYEGGQYINAKAQLYDQASFKEGYLFGVGLQS